jgi:decaprenyl-phosphate phosphoribosyltransferase
VRRRRPGVDPRSLVRAARPRQWVKNVLVLAAPAAAGVLGRTEVLGHVALAFAAFCLLTGGGYLLNDAADVAHDRQHPRRRLRPVAAGAVSVRCAVAVGLSGMAAGLLVAALVNVRCLEIAAGYAAVTVTYSLWLKRQRVLEMAVLACAFVLRAAAGGAAAGVHLSRWFIVVVSFGALFLAAGKRHGEVAEVGAGNGATRAALAGYPLAYLRYVWGMSSTVAIAAYCLWAFAQTPPHHADRTWLELTILPFVLGVLRYALLVEQGHGGAPEELFLRDRLLQLLALAWALIFLCAIYVLGR